jgi:hypothetical protein
MPREEVDVWVPETRSGYFRLFYFGMFMGAVCVGGNSALSSLWSAVAQLSIVF